MGALGGQRRLGLDAVDDDVFDGPISRGQELLAEGLIAVGRVDDAGLGQAVDQLVKRRSVGQRWPERLCFGLTGGVGFDDYRGHVIGVDGLGGAELKYAAVYWGMDRKGVGMVRPGD